MFDWLFRLRITPQITPLVIHSLGGGHTHTHAYIRTEVILRNQARAGLRPARAWFKKASYKYNICMHSTCDFFNLFCSFHCFHKLARQDHRIIKTLIFSFYLSTCIVTHNKWKTSVTVVKYNLGEVYRVPGRL